MIEPTDTPEGRKHLFGSPGRPMTDWEALAATWEGSVPLRDACGGSFATMESHAYAEPETDTADGRALSATVWSAIEAAGYRVDQPKPIHFVEPSEPGFFAKVFRVGRRGARQFTPRM